MTESVVRVFRSWTKTEGRDRGQGSDIEMLDPGTGAVLDRAMSELLRRAVTRQRAVPDR
jgi:hypothetical protein